MCLGALMLYICMHVLRLYLCISPFLFFFPKTTLDQHSINTRSTLDMCTFEFLIEFKYLTCIHCRVFAVHMHIHSASRSLSILFWFLNFIPWQATYIFRYLGKVRYPNTVSHSQVCATQAQAVLTCFLPLSQAHARRDVMAQRNGYRLLQPPHICMVYIKRVCYIY